jgi:hypothetical protein
LELANGRDIANSIPAGRAPANWLCDSSCLQSGATRRAKLTNFAGLQWDTPALAKGTTPTRIYDILAAMLLAHCLIFLVQAIAH